MFQIICFYKRYYVSKIKANKTFQKQSSHLHSGTLLGSQNFLQCVQQRGCISHRVGRKKQHGKIHTIRFDRYKVFFLKTELSSGDEGQSSGLRRGHHWPSKWWYAWDVLSTWMVATQVSTQVKIHGAVVLSFPSFAVRSWSWGPDI